MEKRYTALRIIATIYKILGILVAAITVLGVLAVCTVSVLGGAALSNLGSRELGGLGPSMMGGVLSGLITGGLGLIWGGVIALTLYAFGEAIYLLIALEENTRVTSLFLQRQFYPPEQRS